MMMMMMMMMMMAFNELEKIERKILLPASKSYSNEKCREDSRCAGPISNKAHDDYKSEVLPSERVAGVCVCVYVCVCACA
jgi:hypothetical protein